MQNRRPPDAARIPTDYQHRGEDPTPHLTRMMWRVREALGEGAFPDDEAVIRPICEAYDVHEGDPGDIPRALVEHLDEGYEVVGSVMKRYAIATEGT